MVRRRRRRRSVVESDPTTYRLRGAGSSPVLGVVYHSMVGVCSITMSLTSTAVEILPPKMMMSVPTPYASQPRIHSRVNPSNEWRL